MVSDEFPPRPDTGRVVTIERDVGLGDVRTDARLRLDAMARFLLDVSDADSSSVDIGGGFWILRRLVIELHHAPRFRDRVRLATWCSGTGARWAERRTDVYAGESLVARAAAIWAHVDAARGAPAPLPPAFAGVWGETAAGRKVSARLSHPPPPESAPRVPWFVRATDLDVLHHVNNAAYWEPVEEELAARGLPRLAGAEIEFRGGVDEGEAVELRFGDDAQGFTCWWCVDGDVRASARVMVLQED